MGVGFSEHDYNAASNIVIRQAKAEYSPKLSDEGNRNSTTLTERL